MEVFCLRLNGVCHCKFVSGLFAGDLWATSYSCVSMYCVVIYMNLHGMA